MLNMSGASAYGEIEVISSLIRDAHAALRFCFFECESQEWRHLLVHSLLEVLEVDILWPR